MSRTKKPNQFIYGIEITKPHSSEMYSHNDTVADNMKTIIMELGGKLRKLADDESNPSSETAFRNVVATMCYRFGEGFTLDDIFKEFSRTVSDSENWFMNDSYGDLHSDGLVPTLEVGMVGHGNISYV